MDFEEETGAILNCAFEVLNVLGTGFWKSRMKMRYALNSGFARSLGPSNLAMTFYTRP